MLSANLDIQTHSVLLSQMEAASLSHFDLKDIDIGEKIGKGNVTVYKATMAGKAMAVKKMDCDKNTISQEVEVQTLLPPHPNVLPLIGVAHSRDGFSIYICMELADKSLYHYLHTNSEEPSLQQSTKWAMQIAQGMHHIHQHGLAHRDLKSANVLLFEKEDVAKVCDFGSARVLERTKTVTGMTGTYRWMAPEFNDKGEPRANQRCDVFSYAMVLYEIFTQKIPFYEIDEDYDVATSIQVGKRPSVPPELPLHIKLLMQFCWKHNSHFRPSFKNIFQVYRLALQLPLLIVVIFNITQQKKKMVILTSLWLSQLQLNDNMLFLQCLLGLNDCVQCVGCLESNMCYDRN